MPHKATTDNDAVQITTTQSKDAKAPEEVEDGSSGGISNNGAGEDDLGIIDSDKATGKRRIKSHHKSKDSVKLILHHLTPKLSRAKESDADGGSPKHPLETTTTTIASSSPKLSKNGSPASSKSVVPQSDEQVAQLLMSIGRDTYILANPDEFGPQQVHAATLDTLIQLLPFFRTQDIKAFLYTYRSTCTPPELLSLICRAWETSASKLSDANTLQAYRLRTVNVLRTWVLMHTQDFDADMFCRLRQFVASIPADRYSDSAKNYMMEKIDSKFNEWKHDSKYRESDTVFEALKAFSKKGVSNEHSASITNRMLRQSTDAVHASMTMNSISNRKSSINNSRKGSTMQSRVEPIGNKPPLTTNNQELDVKLRNSQQVTLSPTVTTRGPATSFSSNNRASMKIVLSVNKTAAAAAASSSPSGGDRPSTVTAAADQRQSIGSTAPVISQAITSDKRMFTMSPQELTVVSPRSFAEQLTLINHAVYKGITPSECINQAWMHDNARYHALHILRCIDLFNILSTWTISLVTSIPSVDQRAIALAWVIKLGVHLQKLHNYHSLFAIVAACESAPISRLKKTWSAVEASSLKHLQTLKQMVSSEGSFKKLRLLMKTETVPMIPYIGVYLGDLTFIEDGNPETIEHCGNVLVNFTKMKLLARVIDDIVLYQLEDYKIEHKKDIMSLLEEEFSVEFPSERDLYDLSLKYEPRESG